MECNAYPDRLDLNDVHLRMAKQRGVKIVISTDSHATNHLAFMKYGVITARRGWIEKKDVINTLPERVSRGAATQTPRQQRRRGESKEEVSVGALLAAPIAHAARTATLKVAKRKSA